MNLYTILITWWDVMFQIVYPLYVFSIKNYQMYFFTSNNSTFYPSSVTYLYLQLRTFINEKKIYIKRIKLKCSYYQLCLFI